MQYRKSIGPGMVSHISKSAVVAPRFVNDMQYITVSPSGTWVLSSDFAMPIARAHVMVMVGVGVTVEVMVWLSVQVTDMVGVWVNVLFVGTEVGLFVHVGIFVFVGENVMVLVTVKVGEKVKVGVMVFVGVKVKDNVGVPGQYMLTLTVFEVAVSTGPTKFATLLRTLQYSLESTQ